MALSYDFDIFDVIPADSGDDPDLQALLARLGRTSPLQDGVQDSIALFRNEATAEALRRAPAPLKEYFLAAGFGLNTYDSGAPSGRYPARDEEARLALIHRLTALAPNYPLSEPPAEEGAFSLADFLHQLTQAEPVALEDAVMPHKAVAGSLAPVSESDGRSRRLSLPAFGALAGMTGRVLRGVPRLAHLRRQAASS